MVPPSAIGRDLLPLLGRHEALGAAIAALEQSVAQSVVIAGEIGTGKTRLANEIAKTLERTDNILRLRGTERTHDESYAAIAPLLCDRPELPESAVESLHRAASALNESGAFLLVDDAQWLDDASALTVAQLVAQRWCSAIITCRAPLPLHDALVQLWRDGDAVRIDLMPFTREETGALVVAGLGGEVAPTSIDAIFERTQGNPMFITELLRHAMSTSAVRHEGGLRWIDLPPRDSHEPASVPSRLSELVSARLGRLSPSALDAIAAISVAGPLQCSLAQRSLGTAALLDLEDAAWIVTTDLATAYTVAHPLYGSVVASGVSPTQRSRCFARLYESADNRIDVVQRAQWLAASGLPFDGDVVGEAVTTARSRGNIAVTLELARWWYSNEPTLQVGTILAHNLARYGDVDANLEIVDALLSLATNDIERMLAIVSTAWALAIDDAVPVAIALLENEYSRYGDPLALGGIEGALTSIAQLQGNRLMTVEWGNRAMERTDNPWTQLRASIAMGYSARISGSLSEAMHHSKVALSFDDAISTSMGTLPGEALLVRAETHLELGDLEAAYADFQTVHAEAVQAGHKVATIDSRCGLAHVEVARGLVQSAAVLAREALALCDSIGRDQWSLQVASTLAMCLMVSGEPVELDALVTELTTNRWRDKEHEHVLTARAWQSAARGEFDLAVELHLCAAEFASRNDRNTIAQRFIHNCTRMGRPQPDAYSVLSFPLEGELAELERQAATHWNADASALGEIAGRFERLGFALDAMVCYQQAVHATRRTGAAASALLEHLQRLAAVSGITTLPNGEPVLAESKRTASPTLLTPRELDIARRAARGQRSRRIATDLFVSPRTVDNHLSRVYVKLGINRRDELEIALQSQGLLP